MMFRFCKLSSFSSTACIDISLAQHCSWSALA